MEIKILCGCGAKFKFDVEPMNGRSPGAVLCPSCGTDRTEATNVAIGEKLAMAAAPAPVMTVPTPSSSAAPRISIPAVRIPQPSAAAPMIRVSAPAPAQVAATPTPPPTPIPAPAAVVAPNPAAPAPPTGGPISPKMAFMAAPTSGGSALSVSGGHGKKEAAPAEAAAATPASAPTQVHPATARAAQAMPPKSAAGGGNFGMGVVGAIVGALVVGIIWYLIAANGFALRILAWLPGLGAGYLAVLLGKRPSQRLGIAAAVVAGVITIAFQFAVIGSVNDRTLTRLSERAYRERLELAKKAAAAKTDEEISALMIEDTDTLAEALALAINEVKQDPDAPNPALARYKATKLQLLIKFAKGEPSRAKYVETARAKLAEDEDNLYQVSGFKMALMGLWIISGVSSAFKIAAGKGG